MSNIRKIVCMVMAIILVMSLFAGCSSKEKEETSESTSEVTDNGGEKVEDGTEAEESDTKKLAEKVSISVLLPEEKSGVSKDLLYFTGILERLNIEIEPMAVPKANLKDKLNILIASKNLPDVLSLYSCGGRDYVMDYGPQGAFLDLGANMDKLPNLKKWLDQFKDINAEKFLASPDGNFYGAPTIFEFNTAGGFFNIRLDVVKELNLKIPKTVDEYYQVMKAMKEAYPESYPLTHMNSALHNGIFQRLAPMFGIAVIDNVYFNYDTGKYLDGRLTESFKDMLLWMNKLYEEGLLNPDFAAASREQFTADILNSKAFTFVDACSWADNLNPQGREGGDPDFEIVSFLPPSYEGQKMRVPSSGKLRPTNLLVISSKTEEKEACLLFLDWLYSDEGKTFVSYGEEGVHYTVENGVKKLSSDIKSARYPDGSIDVWTDLGVRRHGWYAILPTIPEYFGKNIDYAFSSYEENDAYQLPQPYITPTEEENDTVKEIKVPYNTYIEENMIKVVLGELTAEEWDNVVEKAKGMGVDEWVNINQKVYDRMYK